MNGNSARFLARRIRVLMTISACGPLPRSHSPIELVRSFNSTNALVVADSFLHFVNTLDFVAQFLRPLVIFFFDRFFHFASHTDDFGALLGAAGALFGLLTFV